MYVRLKEWLLAGAVGLAVGICAPKWVSPDVSRVLVTFIGLIAASILPTISLIMGSMVAGGRSVEAINRLNTELTSATDALFFIFGLSVLSVAVLLCLVISGPGFLSRIPHAFDVMQGIGGGVLASLLFMIISNSGKIPAILRRSLEVRYEISVSEAKRKLLEKAPSGDYAKKAFPADEAFGKVKNLDPTDR